MQAKALANALKDGISDLATKRDVAMVENNLKQEIAEARTEFKQGIEGVRSESSKGITEARAEAKQDTTRLEGKLTLIYAVLGINLAVSLGIFWMMFRYIFVK